MPGPPGYRERLELLSGAQLRRTLTRMAAEILERHPGLEGVVLVGVRTRGVPLARRSAAPAREAGGVAGNLPLEACDDDDVLLIQRWNGKPLPKEHGGPVRMHVPKRYAWKGAKWVKEIIFSAEDRPGYWEIRSYSNTALPWEEDRYA